MNCNEAVSALIASLEGEGTITDAQREHLRTCARCRELLDTARQFQTMLAEPTSGASAPEVANVPDVATVAEQEVARARRRRLFIRIVAVMFGLATLFWMLVPAAIYFGQERLSEIAIGVAMVASLLILVVTPLLLLTFAVREAVNPPSGKRIYKRLGPGRILAGVCLGLSERLGVGVWWLRLGFFVLMTIHGIALLIYILLTIFMPVHPDDRQYLLRFRVRRMLARFRGAPAK
ncbi:MAG TPA: PspC domain-containing protein [Thermoanaerobaculia bacterium]